MKPRRRDFLIAAAALGTGGVGGAVAAMRGAPRTSNAIAQPLRILRKGQDNAARPAGPGPQSPSEEEPYSPPESLMLEHAVQERLWLVFGECAQRLAAQDDRAAAGALCRAATLTRRFYEDCHQKLEELHIFPHFERHERLAPLVRTLKAQHAAGRTLTDRILAGTAAEAVAPDLRRSLAQACDTLVRMSRPHMARETTDLFLTLYEILPEKTIEGIGDRFEEKQEQLLGDGGVAKVIEQVAALEKELGIFELDKFTPAT